MFTHRRYLVLASVIFLLLLTPQCVFAQPAVFAPYRAPTQWESGYKSSATPANSYVVPTSPLASPQWVAQRSAYCAECSPTTPPVGGEMFISPQSSCVETNHPGFGLNGPSNYGNGYGCGSQCGCESKNYLQPNPRGDWYASAAGLYMSRDKSRRVWTTYENNNNSNQLMNTHDADTDWEGGADLRLGRFFACNRWALELGYWSVNNFSGYASQTHANSVSSPLQFNDLEFAVGDPVVDYFDSAAEHRLSRSNELHNIEINLIEGRTTNVGCGPWSHQMLAGVRYFKFDEDLAFETLDLGGTWGGNGGLDEVRLSDSTANDLIGVQLGCMFQRQLGCRTRLVLTPKFGVYNNHIENSFDLRRGDGTAAAPSAISGVAGSYPVESSTDVVAFLSEANIGLQYQATPRWTLFGGYRVVVVTNVGLTDEQIPQFIVDIPEIADIDTSGSLVLQGAYFGATRSF